MDIMRLLVTAVAMICFLVSPVVAIAENKPNSVMTPGEVITTDLSIICQRGYSKSVRKTTRDMKNKVYNLYGIKKHKHYKIDHLVPLCIGGADSIKNIWPSNFDVEKHNANAKDRLELKILHMVCERKMDIRKGQMLFMSDWTAAYDSYCPSREACPSYEEIRQKRLANPYYQAYR